MSTDDHAVGAGQPRPIYRRLVHVGNVVADVVVTVEGLPARGTDVLATTGAVTAGGGCNVMVAAVRQGLPAVYGGAWGTGPFADVAMGALRHAGVAVTQRPHPEMDTGFVVTIVDAGGERTFVTSTGAEATLTRDQVDRLRPGRSDIVYLSGYSLLYPSNRQALLGWVGELGPEVTVVVDPGPLVGDIPTEALAVVLGRADWWTCNAREASILTGSDAPLVAARALAGRTGRQGLLVRDGPRGCVLATPGGDALHIAAPPVDAVDTNGAGDAHTGAFLAALAAGAGPLDAARTANEAAAFSVTRSGPATAPTGPELQAWRQAQP